MCRRAVEIDPNYADAWALIALAEVLLRASAGRQGGDGGLAAAERSLALNPDLAEAHSVKARIRPRKIATTRPTAKSISLFGSIRKLTRSIGLRPF